MSNFTDSEIISSRAINLKVASLLLYQSVFHNEVGQAFVNLLQTLNHHYIQKSTSTPILCLEAYGKWFRTLAARNQSWQDYLESQILEDDNPFSREVQKVSLEDLPPSTITAVKQDLQVLQSLSNLNPQQLSYWVQTACQLPVNPVAWFCSTKSKTFLHQQDNWTDALEELANYYKQQGVGIFAAYGAFRWHSGNLLGIEHPDPVNLSSIVGYDAQKEALLKNTQFFLAGYPALHVLLYGSRGSGKSSLVKGLLPKYRDKGLRLIEVTKSELQYLPTIMEKLRHVPQKFIIFVDDLSFEEDDDAFKALKVVLEGSVTARAENVVVYATSNRRHLVREFFADRPRPAAGDEVHTWDTVQEKLSFSDRFGLTLTFEPANQDTYLKIVRHLAEQAKITLTNQELEQRAKQWATKHNGRSGRTARQFIDFLQGELSL